METPTNKSASDFAKNYLVFLHDTTLAGPVTVGNVTQIDANGKSRTIVNLCLRTAKSGDKNASVSFPSDWSKATRFAKGDQVNIRIEGGYVKDIYAAKPEPIRKMSAATVDSEIKEEISKESTEQAIDDLLNSKEEEQKKELVASGEVEGATPF